MRRQIIDHVTAVAAEEGLEFRMDRALRANTLLAHRLLWLAEPTGHQSAMKERLLQAYFIDGLDIGDPDVLADCAADVGLDRDGSATSSTATTGLAEVREELRVTPPRSESPRSATFVSDGKWMVPGAQDHRHVRAACCAAWSPSAPRMS